MYLASMPYFNLNLRNRKVYILKKIFYDANVLDAKLKGTTNCSLSFKISTSTIPELLKIRIKKYGKTSLIQNSRSKNSF
jgi:hypothetical protein